MMVLNFTLGPRKRKRIRLTSILTIEIVIFHYDHTSSLSVTYTLIVDLTRGVEKMPWGNLNLNQNIPFQALKIYLQVKMF